MKARDLPVGHLPLEGDLIEPVAMQGQGEAKGVDTVFPSGIDCGHEFSASDWRVDRRDAPAAIPLSWLDRDNGPKATGEINAALAYYKAFTRHGPLGVPESAAQQGHLRRRGVHRRAGRE